MKKSTTYDRHFQKELTRLNEAQRTAVEQIEGPVLVVAGPGTGKTHILSARIGKILTQTDAAPHNILCLTFTDAGVHAMRQRLLSFIGPEAHKVHIFTFHSFCNSIIQENIEYFGRNDIEPLGDLERVEIIRKMLEDLPVQHLLRSGRADIYFYEKRLYNLFQMMKEENWSVKYVEQQIDEYLQSLPERDGYTYKVNRGKNKKGDLRVSEVAKETEKMEKLKAAAQLFPVFQEALQKARRYDFADMILWVLKAFETNKTLLRTYQENYLYFLIDEFQDTNGAQNQIIQHLIDYWENPNIFIVGDDDQSIYEFQGARLKNLTDFFDRYRSDLELVVLKDNYRSAQTILNVSRALIDNNQRRIVNTIKELGLDKVLVARHDKFAHQTVRPNIVEYPNRLQENVALVNTLKDLQESDFPLEEVAVIYARHRQAHDLITLLEKHNIPYQTKRKIDILELPIIDNLRAILKYMQAEFQQPFSGESDLFRILHFPFLGIAPRDIAIIAVRMANISYEKRPTWRTVLMDEKQLVQWGIQSSDPILKWTALLEEVLSAMQSIPLPLLVEKIINRSGLLRYVLQQDRRIWLLQVVNSFQQFVRKEADRQPRLSLRQLLQTFENIESNRLRIDLQKTIGGSSGVNLVTAHSAKGLEFEKVFLLDAVKDGWEPASKGGGQQFSLPDTLTYSGEEDEMEARRRLFYVAMTRAKSGLEISYARQSDEGKDLTRTVFIDEIQSAEEEEELTTFEVRELPTEDLVDAQILLLSESMPRIDPFDKAIVEELLKGFSLSISAMNKYLKCPLSFFYENVLNVPAMESEMAAYGTAMHNALQRGFEKMQLDENNEFPSQAAFVRLFEYELQKKRSRFTKKEYQRRLEMGRLYMAGYYDQYATDWTKNVKLEHRIQEAVVKGVPLNGTIDRLDLLPDFKAHIVDYKTGSHSSKKMQLPYALSKRNANKTPEKSHQKYGGNYWRQLIFYKILLENSRYVHLKATEGTISYLNPDTKGDFVQKTITYDKEAVSFVMELIESTYQKIQAHQFYEGCGESYCAWCSFVEQQQPIDSFADGEMEELDD